MNNINLFVDGVSLYVKDSLSFSDLCLVLGKDIVFLIDKNGKILDANKIVSKNFEVFTVTRANLASNLMQAFSCSVQLDLFSYDFKEDLVDSNVSIRTCFVKFKTEKTFSKSEFDSLKSSTKKIFFTKDQVNSLIKDHISEKYFHLPFDFDIESVAQEESDGSKIQKFSLTVFYSSDDQKKYYDDIAALRKTDHRYIGKHLEYFMMIPEAPGSVFWLPKGWKIYRKLENFIRKHAYVGFNEVRTPLVMSNSFWKRSGHLISFKKNMMFVNMGGNDDCCEESALKPMNCPAHIEIFDRKIRSYRDLPLRIAEFGCCHRYEPSGSLHGLVRVRSLTQDDGHIFCALEHVKSETVRFLNNCISIYKKLGFDDLKIILSTKPENALGDPEEWDLAEKYLKESLNEVGLNFSIAEGDGAFYGPKIELHIKDSFDRSWQLGTIQLDFVLPQRFDISFVQEDGSRGKVCMLHRAILGSLERFIGVLLEHCEGKLPIFLAPVQVMVCSVVDEVNDYASKIHSLLLNSGVESELDIRNQTLGYKIREHKLAKVPALAIIGKQEMKNESITIEYLGEKMVFKLNEIEKIMRLFNEI